MRPAPLSKRKVTGVSAVRVALSPSTVQTDWLLGRATLEPAAGGPTLFDEIGVGQARGLEQGDDGGFRVDRFAILLELKIVDAGAGQVDRALEVGGGKW